MPTLHERITSINMQMVLELMYLNRDIQHELRLFYYKQNIKNAFNAIIRADNKIYLKRAKEWMGIENDN